MILGYGVSIKQKSSFDPAGYAKGIAGFCTIALTNENNLSLSIRE